MWKAIGIYIGLGNYKDLTTKDFAECKHIAQVETIIS